MFISSIAISSYSTSSCYSYGLMLVIYSLIGLRLVIDAFTIDEFTYSISYESSLIWTRSIEVTLSNYD